MNLNCVCNRCKIHYELFFNEENQLCRDCISKMINFDPKIIKSIDDLYKIRSSKWYELKKYTYYFLFNAPIIAFFTFKFGITCEIIYLIGIFIAVLGTEWCEWCADKL